MIFSELFDDTKRYFKLLTVHFPMLFPTFSQWRTRFLIATFIETVRIWKWSRYDVKPAKQGRYTSGRADTSDLCSHVCNPGAPVIFVIDIHNVKNTHTFCLRSPDIALIFRLHENCTYSVYISILSPIHLLKKKIYIYIYIFKRSNKFCDQLHEYTYKVERMFFNELNAEDESFQHA